MIEALRSRWVFASLATLFYWLALHSLQAYVPIRMSDLGASDAQIGVAVASRALPPMLLAMGAGRLSDRLGGHRVLVPAALVMAVATWGHAAAASAWHFMALQAVVGISTMGVWVNLQSAITHAGSGSRRQRHLALFSLAWGAGQAAGPALGALVYDVASFKVLCAVSGVLSILIVLGTSLIPWGDTRTDGRQAAAMPRISQAIAQLIGRPGIRAVLLSSFATHYLHSIRNSFYPVLLERRGFTVSQVGLLLSIIGVTSLAVRILLPWLGRHAHLGRVLAVTTIAGAVAIVLTPYLVPYWSLMVGAAVLGCSSGLNPPITVDLIAQFTTATERGLSAGLRVTCNRAAQVVQPLLFGSVAPLVGTALAFPMSGLVLGPLCYALVRSTRRLRAGEPATAEVP